MSTFIEIYQAVTREKTPRQMFVERIAKATGMSESAVNMWTSGQRVPGMKSKRAIAKELKKSVDVLFPEKE